MLKCNGVHLKGCRDGCVCKVLHEHPLFVDFPNGPCTTPGHCQEVGQEVCCEEVKDAK